MTSGVPANQVYYGSSPVAYAPPGSTGSAVGQLEHGFIQSALGWGGRVSFGRAIDEVYHSKRGIAESAPRSGTSYGQILGLTTDEGAKANLAKLKPTAAWNRLAQNDINGGKFSIGRYAKETMYEYNFKGLGNYKVDPGGSLARGLGLGYLGWGVFKDTKAGYESAQTDPNKGTLGVAGSTASAFAVSGAKAVAAWEVSNALMDVGKAVLPGLTYAKIPFGGIILGALGAVATGIVLDKIIPSPKSPAEASQDNGATYMATQNALQQGNPFINPAQATV